MGGPGAGAGSWGMVCEGYFRGQLVVVKCVLPDILLLHTRERIRREITTMAQVRHPNLVLFVAACHAIIGMLPDLVWGTIFGVP